MHERWPIFKQIHGFMAYMFVGQHHLKFAVTDFNFEIHRFKVRLTEDYGQGFRTDSIKRCGCRGV